MTIIYQRARTGKIKYIKVWTKGAELIREWGTFTTNITTDGSVPQQTKKVCKGMNIGKANETTPAQQAVLEMTALLERKMKEGYCESIPDAQMTSVATGVQSSNVPFVDFPDFPLPKSFCPCKPISKTPTKILNDPATYGQRKYNGHCIVIASDDTKMAKVYSRRIEDITEFIGPLPIVQKAIQLMPPQSIILFEMVFFKKNGKESTRQVSKLVRKKDAIEVLARYNEFSKEGEYKCIPLDALFLEGNFIGNIPHLERMGKMSEQDIDTITIITDWKGEIEKAKKANWEGFVLRKNDESSYISFTMDGKAYRQGSYKFKFLHTDDFVVTGATYGKAGKHANLYAQFNISQYVDNKLVSFGNCGPGKLPHTELKELTAEIDSGKRKFPFVVEIEYQSRQEDSGKLEFGQICRIRDDKPLKECICEDEVTDI